MPSLKRQWTGNIRRSIKRAKFDLSSITNYNSKHPSWGLLSSGDLTAILNVQIILTEKLNAKVLR